MNKNLGIYIHVPFCEQGKCPYCDFYSVAATDELKEKYITAVKRDIKNRSAKAADRTVDTVYFGGGTPSLLGEGLARILKCVRENFTLDENAEITFEANPAGVSYELFSLLLNAGFNRLSLGMQSAIPRELEFLGRRHTPQKVEQAVSDAKRAGFDNISLDLMLCIPEQTKISLRKSVDFAANLSPRHISAYLLKIEEGTRFYKVKDTLNLPDDDAQAEMYLEACDALESHGYKQYEISNFAFPGYESRHNLKYWNCDEYLGFGPSAHSFFDGKRFYLKRGLNDYFENYKPVNDGDGGTFEEYVMLRLRLSDGINETELSKRYGKDFSCFGTNKVNALEGAGLLKLACGRLFLTQKGFLVSNSVIGELLFA